MLEAIAMFSMVVGAFAAIGFLARGGGLAAEWRRAQGLLRRGDYFAAEAVFRQTLAIAEKRFGADHWRVTLHLNALAVTLMARRNVAGAEPLVERALATLARFEVLPHAEVGVVFLGAAQLRALQARHDEATRFVEQAKRVLGPTRAVAARATTLMLAIERGDPDAILLALDAGAPKGTAIPPLARIAERALASGEAAVALRCFDRAYADARQRAPSSYASAFYAFGRARSLASLGKHDEALRAAKERALLAAAGQRRGDG